MLVMDEFSPFKRVNPELSKKAIEAIRAAGGKVTIIGPIPGPNFPGDESDEQSNQTKDVDRGDRGRHG